MYQPYQYQPPMPYQTPSWRGNELQFVNGIESARMYQLNPNSKAVLMDRELPRFYLVESDASGQKAVTAYDFKAAEEPKPEFVTRDEFDTLRSANESVVRQIGAIAARLEELSKLDEPNAGKAAGGNALEPRANHAKPVGQAD